MWRAQLEERATVPCRSVVHPHKTFFVLAHIPNTLNSVATRACESLWKLTQMSACHLQKIEEWKGRVGKQSFLRSMRIANDKEISHEK